MKSAAGRGRGAQWAPAEARTLAGRQKNAAAVAAISTRPSTRKQSLKAISVASRRTAASSATIACWPAV